MALSICYWVNYVQGKVKLMRRSENAVASDHVLKFIFDRENLHVQSVVQASMKDQSYRVEIILDEFFGVASTSCECPLGNFCCHHVAAALLFGYKRASETDIKCSWLKTPKSKIGQETSTMEDLFPPCRPEYRALNREVSELDLKFMFEALCRIGRFTGFQWILSPEPEAVAPLLPFVEDLVMSPGFLEAPNQSVWLRRQLHIDPVTVTMVLQKTIGQRKNPLWSVVRKHRLTASNFGPVLAAINRNRYPPSLQKRLLTSQNLDTVRSIAWGNNNESVAIELYCKQGAVVEETGIWMHESGVLGASPDGIVKVPPKTRVNFQNEESALMTPDLIEVKCPHSARDMTVQEAMVNLKGFFLVRDSSNSITLDSTHHYYHQIQGQLHLAAKHCCDLIVMTRAGIEIVRIARDPKWTQNINKLIDFYFNTFISFLKT